MLYFIAGIVLLVVIAFLQNERPAPPVRYLPVNPQRTPVKPAGFKGTPVDSRNRYVYEEAPYYQDFLSVFVWMPSHLFSILFRRQQEMEVHRSTDTQFLHGEDGFIWLGHASFFLRTGGKNLLIDPHFNGIYHYRRYSANPVDPTAFAGIDYILLSHDHADHCDPGSLEMLIAQNPQVTLLAGAGMHDLLDSFSPHTVRILTAAWYEKFPINDVDICFVPSRHYSKRIFQPFNSRLWGGFIISRADSRGPVYFAGDSGYAPVFGEVGALFQPSVCMIGVGASSPQWFMEANHTDPWQALQAFKDTGASTFIPMHYGTFRLGNETTADTRKALEEMAQVNPLFIPVVGKFYAWKELELNDSAPGQDLT